MWRFLFVTFPDTFFLSDSNGPECNIFNTSQPAVRGARSLGEELPCTSTEEMSRPFLAKAHDSVTFSNGSGRCYVAIPFFTLRDIFE